MSRQAPPPPIQYTAQMQPGTHLVPESQPCPGDHRWYQDGDACRLCGGTGKVLSWRVVADVQPPRGRGHFGRKLVIAILLGLLLGGAYVYATGNNVRVTPVGITTEPPPVASAAAPATAARATTTQPAEVPAPAVIPASASWSPAVCDWAIKWLTEDSRLDRQAAAKGTDPRWPSGTPEFYTNLAAQWDGVTQLVALDCGRRAGTPGLDVPNCQTAIAWLDRAATAHDADLSRAGATASDTAWNKAWSGFYHSLSADLAPGCGA